MSLEPEFYFSYGYPSVKFEEVDDEVELKVISQEITQQSKMETGELLYWHMGRPQPEPFAADGRTPNQPVNQLVVTGENLATGETQRLFIKGKSLTDAVKAALREKNVGGLAAGGVLKVKMYATEPSKTRGFKDRKLFKASYKLPEVSLSDIEAPW